MHCCSRRCVTTITSRTQQATATRSPAGKSSLWREVLAHYGEIISSDADDESVFYLIDLEEVPVGAIEPRQFGPSDNPIESKDDGTAPDLTNRENAVAAQIITIGSPHENGENVVADADDLGTQDLHFVLCDFGRYGRAYIETDPAKADASTIVRNLLQGQY